MKNKVSLVVLLIFIIFSITSISFIYAQESTATSTLNTELSDLAANPCNIPCWFDIVPGKSSAKDVVTFLKDQGVNYFFDFGSKEDKNTGYLVDGAYSFFINGYLPDNSALRQSYVIIEKGSVSHIKISTNRVITLDNIIQLLGWPDYIFFTPTQINYFDFIYLNSLTRIHFYEPIKLRPIKPCTAASINEKYWIEFISFYSPISAYQPEWRPETKIEINGYKNGESQPRLLAHSISYQEYSIDPKQFQKFVELKDDTSCEKLFQNLPEATSVPIPTIVPEITATAKP